LGGEITRGAALVSEIEVKGKVIGTPTGCDKKKKKKRVIICFGIVEKGQNPCGVRERRGGPRKNLTGEKKKNPNKMGEQ